MPFIFEKTKLKNVYIITPKIFEDNRGFFMETYKFSDFKKNNIPHNFTQDNHSLSKGTVVRGIHFQKYPKEQGKLVRCIKGTILDVAVDLDPNSVNYLQWVSVILSEKNKKMLYIPPGFGHGFSTLVEKENDVTEVSYKCTGEYDAELDSGIRWNDPALRIDWRVKNPTISLKDSKLPLINT